MAFPFTRGAATAVLLLLCFRAALCAQAQTKAAPPAGLSLEQAVKMVQSGKCQQAMPVLKRGYPKATSRDTKYQAGMALVRCAMSVQDEQTAADTLFAMERDFASDPEVLYIATHYFSEMGIRASQVLVAKAPDSFQARKLEAEAAESQGKNDDAVAIYRSILAQSPKTPGIHYRLGQVLLAQAGQNGPTDEAKKEFQQELEIDPLNAASEFVLGELARRQGMWDEAIPHFTKASQLDVGFAEAYLALGMSLGAANRFADAVHPLENYVRLQPEDPAGHYQLGLAYSRTGNKQAAAEQIALQAKAAQNATTDNKEGHAIH